MAFDDSLPAEKDWVRLLIGDNSNVAAKEALTDAEILGFIALQTARGSATKTVAIRFYAAADALESIYRKRLDAGNGQLERETPELRVKWGGLNNKEESMRATISNLRRQGADAEGSRIQAF